MLITPPARSDEMGLSLEELKWIHQGLVLRLGIDACNDYKLKSKLMKLLSKIESEIRYLQDEDSYFPASKE